MEKSNIEVLEKKIKKQEVLIKSLKKEIKEQKKSIKKTIEEEVAKAVFHHAKAMHHRIDQFIFDTKISLKNIDIDKK